MTDLGRDVIMLSFCIYVQDGCGVTAGWYTYQCHTYMVRGLLGRLHHWFCHWGRSYTWSLMTRSIRTRHEIWVQRSVYSKIFILAIRHPHAPTLVCAYVDQICLSACSVFHLIAIHQQQGKIITCSFFMVFFPLCSYTSMSYDSYGLLHLSMFIWQSRLARISCWVFAFFCFTHMR